MYNIPFMIYNKSEIQGFLVPEENCNNVLALLFLNKIIVKNPWLR